jgi:hypothetical protein
MGEYHRITRECTLDALRPALADAIRAYLEKRDLVDVAAAALMCCETVSTKQKKRLFGKKTEVMLLGVLLTPQWLVWAVGKEGETPGVLAARLRDIHVQDYETTTFHKMIPDTGIHIDGLRTSEGEGSAFIGLGIEPEAQKFRDALKEAVAQA